MVSPVARIGAGAQDWGMSASHLSELGALAAELRAELATYEAGMERLVRHGDPQDCMALAEQFDRMQLLARPLARIAVSWIDLLISRFELTEEICLQRRRPAAPGRLLGMHARHALAIHRLRRSLDAFHPEPGGQPRPDHAEGS